MKLKMFYENNDYKISIFASNDSERYFIQYKMVTGINKKIEIDLETFKLYDEVFKKPMKLVLNELNRHLDEVEIDEHIENGQFANLKPSVEQTVLAKLELATVMEAVATCTPAQQKRFKLKFVQGLTLKEIAAIQKCNVSAVERSINKVLKKIKK